MLIGTHASWLPGMPQIAYGASKGALRSAMYYMAKDLGPMLQDPPYRSFANLLRKRALLSAFSLMQSASGGRCNAPEQTCFFVS